MTDKKESQIKNINGALYDKNGHIVGHAKFDEVQIDTLSYQSLSDKVIGILTGNPNFTSEEINEEYDEEEGEWDNANDETDVDPVDEYSDKSDIFDLNNDLNEKIEKVKKSVVEEGKNMPSEAQKSSSEPSIEEKQE